MRLPLASVGVGVLPSVLGVVRGVDLLVPMPVVWAGLVGVAVVSQVLKVWEPGMAPADVLAKTVQPVTDTDDGDDDDDDDERSDGGKKAPLPFLGKGGLPLF